MSYIILITSFLPIPVLYVYIETIIYLTCFTLLSGINGFFLIWNSFKITIALFPVLFKKFTTVVLLIGY